MPSARSVDRGLRTPYVSESCYIGLVALEESIAVMSSPGMGHKLVLLGGTAFSPMNRQLCAGQGYCNTPVCFRE